MQLLDDHFTLRNQIFDYFGYVEDWRVLPFDDAREFFWCIEDDESVHYATSESALIEQDGECYSNEIYTQRHLPKWVYRGPEFTMICVDTQTDGNQFLQIFDNSKERPDALPAQADEA